jgi:hypothetical protein
MDLEELRAFLDVVETGSYLAAADSLGVSRTTLRLRVEASERQLRVSVPRALAEIPKIKQVLGSLRRAMGQL